MRSVYSLIIEDHDTNEGKTYISFCLEQTTGEWSVTAHPDEQAAKDEIVAEGGNLAKSFVLKVPLPKAEKIVATEIRTLEVGSLTTKE